MGYDKIAVMYRIEPKNWDKILTQVKTSDIYIDLKENIKGLEQEPHVTILYGIEPTEDKKKLLNICKQFPKIEIEGTGVSIFKNEKFDVLKIDVNPIKLLPIHNFLKDNFEFENDYPDYHPHITIAYLKPNCGKKYCNPNTSITCEAKSVWISGPGFKS
jgi:hypothetical protein